MPRDFRLQASYENVDWFTVLTVTGESGWSPEESRAYAVDYDVPGPVDATYTTNSDKRLVDEGDDITYTTLTEGVPNGTTLRWRLADANEPVHVSVEHEPEQLQDSGTATGGAASQLVDTSQDWTPDEYAGELLRLVGGTGDGQERTIASNTSDTLAVAEPWDTEPDATTGYEIVTPAIIESYTTENSVDANDLTGTSLDWGTFEVNDNQGQFTLSLREDFWTEGPEYLLIEILDGDPLDGGEVVETVDPVIVRDTSNIIGYDFTMWQSATVVSEGGTLSMSVTSDPPLPEGTVIRWLVDGDIDQDDYTIPGGSSWSTIDANGTAGWAITFVEDELTEGDEQFVVHARIGLSAGPVVGTTQLVTVLDTSRSPPTYAISGPGTVDEGDTANHPVTTTDIPDGTVLWWQKIGDVDADDFADGLLAGQVTINDNAGVIPRGIAADLTTEGDGVVASGTATGGGESSIEDTGASFIADEHKDRLIILTTGTGSGQVRQVAAHDAGTVLPVTEPWEIEPDETTGYQIVQEAYQMLLLDGPGGNILARSGVTLIMDTSVNPPEYYLTRNHAEVIKGNTASFTLVAFFVVEDLYWDIIGTATGADFTGSISGSIGSSGGTINLTTVEDTVPTGSRTVAVRIRTGSPSGPVVATSLFTTILNPQYLLEPSTTEAMDGDTVAMSLTTQYVKTDSTLHWVITGSTQSDDFVGDVVSGTVTMVSGEGDFNIVLDTHAEPRPLRFFRVELRWGAVDGPIVVIARAVVVQSPAVDYDAWLGSLDGVRILLLELDHSDGVEYIANYPYLSRPTDTAPNRGYDEGLLDAVDIEARLDGRFNAGRITAENGGARDGWLDLAWRGYEIRMLMGEPKWSLDDFRLVARLINGGIDKVERGQLSFSVFDGKAVFAKPLQTDLLPDGRPVPVAFGEAFNVPAALIDRPEHEYQVNEGAIISVAVRANGVVQSATPTLGAGTFKLGSAAIGTVTADVAAAETTAAAIVAAVAARYGVSVDSESVGDLPTYPLGLYYNSQARGDDVLRHVAESLGGHWDRGALGMVEMYQLTEPAAEPDIVITADDILPGGLVKLRDEEPVKTLTLHYQRNFSPQARDSLAGSVQENNPEFADELAAEWRQVSVTNDTTDYPLAADRDVYTYLVDKADAEAECARRAALHEVPRQRWECTCFISVAHARPGRTALITYPSEGWQEGKPALIVGARQTLTRGLVRLEIWL